MENKLEIFKNEEFGEIRVLDINNEQWFVGKDIATTLAYKEPHKAITKHIDEEDRIKYPILSEGGIQDTWLINESGFYSLVLSSKLPSAKKFKKWVTSEVLPSIRKHGEYKIPKTPMETLALMFEVQKENAEKIEKLDNRVYEIEENAPLNPGENGLISTKVSEKIRNVKRELGLDKCTQAQNKELYSAINREIKVIAGVKTRSQLRQKHLDEVLDFIRDWEPSKATRVILEQLKVELA